MCWQSCDPRTVKHDYIPFSTQINYIFASKASNLISQSLTVQCEAWDFWCEWSTTNSAKKVSFIPFFYLKLFTKLLFSALRWSRFKNSIFCSQLLYSSIINKNKLFFKIKKRPTHHLQVFTFYLYYNYKRQIRIWKNSKNFFWPQK